MGFKMRMFWVPLWLMACLAFSSLFSPTTGSPMNVMTAPNVLRVGTEERIFIEVQDCVEQNVDVRISVKNHPTKTTEYAWTSVTLTRQNDFQAFGKIVIPADRFVNNRNVKQYVTLQAHFPGHLLEKVVLVSYQSAYIFIQTDKPIYTPGSTVRYRVFTMWPDMESPSDSSINLDIMTPDGIVVESKVVSLGSGIYSETYTLGNIVSFGNWKMMAKFHSNEAESFTAEFEVKEYVLPSFEVQLSTPPESPFFYVDSKELQITIKARYMFGKEVDGTAYVVFGVILGNEKKSFTSSLQRVPIQRGNGEVKLLREHITDVYQNINQLLGNSIYVSVSVLTQSGGEMVEAELRGIMIVESPYTIHFKKTPEYFKPGLSFDVMVEVVNPDGSPADSVPILVNPGGISAVTKSNGMARLPINTEPSLQRLEISARTNHPQVLSHRQAKATMVAFPYKSPTNSLLHLSVHSAEVKLGEQMKIDLYFTKPEIEQKDITYMILSRGQLVKHFRQRGNLKQMAFMVDITKEMLPSFRIVAFYHTNKNELVSDSVWVDVTDTCMGTLKLEMTRPTASYEPRRSFNLKITGDPGATVGLVAVDKSVYALNNKNRLTQKKIWDVVEKYDTGCKPGGGKDAMNVFYDAGLLFVNNNGVTPDRTDLICPAHTRRKRASTVMEVRTSLISQYTDKLQKDCCLDGMKETPVSYSCKRRVQYIVDGPSCAQAFLHCCEEMQKQKDDKKVEVLHLARSEIDDGYTDRNDIMTRTNFPESWLWNDIRLSGCPTNDPNCKTVTLTTKTFPFPDTITTWQLTGISLSRTHGVCVAKPLEAIVWKPFFVDLRLPYSAVQGEQLEIKAIIHNYNDDTITVRIEFKEEDYICSAAYNKKWFQDEVQVGAQSTRSVPFIIIPMKHGSFPIEIKASVKNSYLSDGIKKMLRVVPQGVLMTESTKVTLYPARKGGRQVELINSNVSMADLVPSTPMNTLISLTGIGQMNSLLDNAISGESMGTLINEPRGCGEQNMAAMTLPVIAAIYLDKTNQWEAVGFDKRNKAIQHIKTGYGTQLKYHKPDGSFAIFSYSKSTTWLTAYVAKVFSMATSYARIDSSVICGAIKFLILHTQQPDGLFVEIGEVWDKNMIGDVGGVDSDASMTAFCLIAMRESSGICSSSISSLPNTIRKAETYLEQRLGSLTNPYAVALTSYALAMNKKLNREILFKFAAPDRSHWPVPRGIIIAREATAYALLALVKDGAIEEAKPIVRWLSQQQKVNGGYGSTQATIMVYQAVAEYASNVREPPFDLNVDIAIQGRSLIDKINFNNENHYTTRTSKFDGINKDVKVTATGTGEAMFNMVSLYYAIPSKEERDCEMFDMKLKLIEVNSEEGARVYKLKIEILYKNREKNASMSILDVGLPTGYNFNKNDLDALSKGHDRIIADYEANTALSERGSLIIYLSKVSNTQYEEITFKIEQQMKVAFLQPAAVSVYEYYNKKRCVQFYRPGRISGELLTFHHNDGYLCAEENCSKQKKEKINNDERTNKACESTESSKIDFVYKVIVEDVFNNYTTDTYSMRILETFKLGSTDVAPKDKLRLFLGYQHCREALGLQPSKTYLIMGSSSNIRIIGTSFQYILGETTWVEYWPTTEECQTDKHRPTCMGMELLEEQIEDFGCNMK
ncbi:complement C3 [Fundulus heteroclitus]|uniref:complement C3 n=1 Tax=Fundulus heteroclitus TaxID=8078 RepID=UPI00165CB948|nr:complement C3 [Fundulus heteroclitus]